MKKHIVSFTDGFGFWERKHLIMEKSVYSLCYNVPPCIEAAW